MLEISAYNLIFTCCGLVILSYIFSVLNRITRIPSVLMLLGTGLIVRQLLVAFKVEYTLPQDLIEILGTVGLIMIVVEAGLDLEVNRSKLSLIKGSFTSALIIFIVSSLGITAIFYYLLHFQIAQSAIYAIPLSIVSSAIVLPSVGHLEEHKREFLIYEASFSDILGIMVFNFIAAGAAISLGSVGNFFGSIVIAVILSVVVCVVLIWILLNNKVNTRFFLIFSVLIVVYIGGKSLQLPSLLTIMIFGLIVNNWELITWAPIQKHFPIKEVEGMATFLKSITAETSFLIRTFFFVLFGMEIDLNKFLDPFVLEVGTTILCVLMLSRFIYLRILHKYNLFPEVLYSPRGLITVLLFYKIPEGLKTSDFNVGILYFVIISTNLIMMIGALVYKKPIAVLEDKHF